MKKFIEVHDDLPTKLVNELEFFILEAKELRWMFNPNVSGVDGQTVPGFASAFYSSENKNTIQVDYLPFLLQPLYFICFLKKIIIKNIFEARVFLQTPSLNPGPHTSAIHSDLPFPHWVCLYYVNDCDKKGETIFFDDQHKEIKRVSPKKGRVVLFDGSIKHTGSSSNSMRAVINICFFGKKV